MLTIALAVSTLVFDLNFTCMYICNILLFNFIMIAGP